jgi:hypothetical protein
MPKKSTTPAATPPAEDLEAAATPAPKARRAKLRTTASAASFGHFGAPPRGATHWGVRRFRADGGLERIGGPSPDGAMVVHEWPLEELSDAIATRLPPGRYKLEWIGDHPTKGQRTHLSWGREFVVPGEKAPPIASASSASAPASSSSPLAASVDALGALRSIRSLVREERELVDQGVSQQLSALAQLAAVMRPATPQAPPADPQIGQALTAIATTLQSFNERLAALEEGDDDDDDEEEDDDDEEDDDAGDGGDAGELFTPRGESHGDVAVAAGLNKLASFLDGIKPGAEAFAVEWLQDQAAQMATRRAQREAAAASGAHALNGHAPIGVTSASSSPSESTDAQG